MKWKRNTKLNLKNLGLLEEFQRFVYFTKLNLVGNHGTDYKIAGMATETNIIIDSFNLCILKITFYF